MTVVETDTARRRLAPLTGVLLGAGVVAVLGCLALANVAVQATWRAVADGVRWEQRPEGLVAETVEPGTAGARAGLFPGDILLDVDGEPVESHADLRVLLRVGADRDAPLRYTVLRLGESRAYRVTVERVPAVNLPIYLALAGVGLFGLLVGASVRIRRPGHQATLHFFWLTVAFFGVFAFSFSERLDRLDWVFFWADEVSLLLLAPLFLHFALVFPERSSGWMRRLPGVRVLPAVYAPALLLGAAQAAAVLQGGGGGAFTGTVETIWELQHLYLAGCILGGLAAMTTALRRVTSVTARRQLRWVVSGAVLGGVPFTCTYAIPYALGFTPAAGLELTALPLALVPLAFASAIVHYRLRDVEVIVKRNLGYAAVAAAMATLYLALTYLWSEVVIESSDGHDSLIALLTAAVVILLAGPVKRAIQTLVDRAYYRERFDHRRALVRFARDLNADLDLARLSERLVSQVSQSLGVERMALLLSPSLASEGASAPAGDFRPIRWTGLERPLPLLPRASAIGRRLAAQHTALLDDPATIRKYPSEELAAWRDRGLYYFVPCIAEGATIAVMALGRKESGGPLSSEDITLLGAVAGQVAMAVANGRLYGQLQAKARELDRMRQFSERIVDSLSDGLLVLDVEDRVVRSNPRLEELYGLPRETAVGARLEDLFDADFVRRLRQARAETPARGVLYRVPLVSRHEPPRSLLVNAATAPLQAPDGSQGGTTVIVEDITSRVQLEEQLQISEKMASIGLLAAGVAHEVNTPLTGISSFTQMLLDGADPADPRTRLLEKIERQTFRAAKIVNGLLNLARPSDAKGPLDLNAVINDVLSLLEHQLENGNVRIRRMLAEAPPVVQGVEFKIQQVFLNLFLNARDSMPAGGWLTVSTRHVDGRAVVEVGDTGAGIPPEHLSRIYDPFFTTKAAGQGTGLGLSITYGVIQEHRGTMECDSQPGRGTRFRIRLPLADRPGAVAAGSG